MNMEESEEIEYDEAIEVVDTLIVSDIHLGSEVSRSKKIDGMLGHVFNYQRAMIQWHHTETNNKIDNGLIFSIELL